MATHSFADRLDFNCDTCGQPFSSEIWLIIDAAERPDLLARVRDRTIHRIVCPNGHVCTVDAPLLIFRPQEARPLLFSPAQQTTVDQDRQKAIELIDRLSQSLRHNVCDRLRRAWRDEWLEGVTPIPRAMLPKVLESPGNPDRAQIPHLDAAEREAASTVEIAAEPPALSQDSLLSIVKGFIQAETWFDSYHYTKEHPELLTEAADVVLVRLIGETMMAGKECAGIAYTECLILLRRAREAGVGSAFAEKLGTTPEQLEAASAAGRPELARGLVEAEETENMVRIPPKYCDDVQRAEWAKQQYYDFGDSQALDEAILAWERVLNHAGFVETPKRFQLAAKNAAAIVLKLRYRVSPNLPDLKRALEYWTEIVGHPSVDPDVYTGYLNNLTTGWLEAYRLSGHPSDLDNSIGALRAGIAQTQTDSSFYAGLLNNLADCLWRRYTDFRQPVDLDEAISKWEEASRKTSGDPSSHAEVLNGLATGLQARFVAKLQRSDLKNAIRYYREAICLTPVRAVERASRLSNLSGALFDRYQHLGQSEDLIKALRLIKYARLHTLSHSLDYIDVLNDLANILLISYRWRHRATDLDSAAAMAREACKLSRNAASETTLHASHTWADISLRQGDWEAVLEAVKLSSDIIEQLDQVNVLSAERSSWRRKVQGLAAAEAYAHARQGDVASAVLALETGQAGQLNVALGRGRDRELLERLSGDDPILFAAYKKAAAEARTAQRASGETRRATPDPWLGAAGIRDYAFATQATLDAIVKHIQELPSYKILFTPTDFADVAAAVGEAPLAYLAATSAGSVILLLHYTDNRVIVEALWASLTEDELERLLLKRAVETTNVGSVIGGLLPGQSGQAIVPEAEVARLVAVLGSQLAAHRLADIADEQLSAELGTVLSLLGEKLMTPLAARLRELEATAVTLIPGGRLSLLPLHAATYQVGGASQTFLDEFAVAYAPSAQAVAESRAQAEGAAPDRPGALVVGNPMLVSQPLRYAREEAEEVAVLLGAAAFKVTPLYETGATLDAVRQALPGQRLFHFAGHGIFDPDEPLDSGLIMANEERLTLRAIRDSEALAGTRLAVLSACQTSMTDFRELPDEVIGLPTGFLAAGAAGVVGSLWPVDGRSTALLMTAFHRRVLAGDAPADALRAAQLWLRGVTWGELDAYYSGFLSRMTIPNAEEAQTEASLKDPTAVAYSEPYHWAAFTFSGA